MTALNSVPFDRLNDAQWLSLVTIEAQHHVVPWSKAQLHASIAAGYTTQALLDKTQQVVAYSIFMPNVDDWELLNITVSQAMQGRGLARGLLTQGLDQARSAGADGVFLEVRDSNAAALGLYTALGFAQVGMRKGYYRTANPLVQENAIVMRLAFK